MTNSTEIERTSTVLEDEWNLPSGHIFKSDKHKVMAVADKYPKMPLQVIIALAKGTPGKEQHFYDLTLNQQRKIQEVGLVVGAKIFQHCTPGQRSMSTLEGFAVPDHAHVIHYAGIRRQGIDRYTGELLGEEAVQHTLELITFTPVEIEQTEFQLDQIDTL